MILASDITLPDHAGYVAAAYLVFLVLLLIYLAIMATRVGRIEKETAELLELAARERDAGERAPTAPDPAAGVSP